MNITNQDIIRTARQLRDEENEQLNVRSEFNRTRPWRHVPKWLIAIPAAAIIGFVVGIRTRSPQNDVPLTALVDTVFINVPVQQPPQVDTVIQIVQPNPIPVDRQTARSSTKPSNPQSAVGRSVADDQIRYDLLVRN